MKHRFSILLFLCISISSVIKAKDYTNVVLILIDDLSHYGVSAYGANAVSSDLGFFEHEPVRTPQIDKLAHEGLLCRNAFAYPLCEASRIALMSGQNNNRNYLRCKSQHASDITFGDTFKKAGYATGIFGKWKQTRGTKTILGKDYIYEFGWDEFCCFDVVDEKQRYINPNLVINGVKVDYAGRTDVDPATGRRWYGPDICNRHALNFIDKNKDSPFFLYYPMLLVHDEHKPTPDTEPHHIFDTFDEVQHNRDGHHGNDHRYFPDMIRYMDKLIGRVVAKIDELHLSEKTLIIVMGDNGTKECFTHVFPDGSTYPGRKGGNADNGIHVPLVLRQPGTINSGDKPFRYYDGLVNLTDIYPTIAEAAGIEIPNKNFIDGISFWDQVKGKKTSPHRDYIYTWYNANYPYTSTETVIEYAFTKDFKLYAPSKDFPKGRFFDLRNDLLEREGDYHVKLQWGILQYNGIPYEKLTQEQRKAYKQLQKVLSNNKLRHVQSLKIHTSKNTFLKGNTYHLSCDVRPRNATRRNIIWESSDPNIATINKFGELTAIGKGQVTIRAYSWDDAFPQAANGKRPYLKTGISDQLTINIL